jgi:hypothetical protein
MSFQFECCIENRLCVAGPLRRGGNAVTGISSNTELKCEGVLYAGMLCVTGMQSTSTGPGYTTDFREGRF